MLHEIITTKYLKSGYTLITVDNIPADTALSAAEILTTVSDAGVNIDMICQTPPYSSSTDISFTFEDKDLMRVLTAIGSLRAKFPKLRSDVNPGNCKLFFFGEEMVNTPGVAAGVLTMLSKAGLGIKLITTSDKDISILIDAADQDAAASLFDLSVQ